MASWGEAGSHVAGEITMEVNGEQRVQSEPRPKFVFPHIHDNPVGWGPCAVPEQFKDTPYQPFSKDDRLGKVRVHK